MSKKGKTKQATTPNKALSVLSQAHDMLELSRNKDSGGGGTKKTPHEFLDVNTFVGFVRAITLHGILQGNYDVSPNAIYALLREVDGTIEPDNQAQRKKTMDAIRGVKSLLLKRVRDEDGNVVFDEDHELYAAAVDITADFGMDWSKCKQYGDSPRRRFTARSITGEEVDITSEITGEDDDDNVDVNENDDEQVEGYENVKAVKTEQEAD